MHFTYLVTLDPACVDIDSTLRQELAPLVHAIDETGLYPGIFFHALANANGFKPPIDSHFGGFWGKPSGGLPQTIGIMAHIADYCVSSAFVYWCHTITSRYIQLSSNDLAKARYLPRLATGQLAGATGLSNPIKSISGIEKFLLHAEQTDGGYIVNGTLPWVSNTDSAHLLVTAAAVDGMTAPLFFLTPCNAEGFSLAQSAHFIGLEGTLTHSCHLKHVFIPDEAVLAHPDQSPAFIRRILPGMVLSQTGMALGLINDCIRLIEKCDKSHPAINRYAPIQSGSLTDELIDLQTQVEALAGQAESLPVAEEQELLMLAVLKLRLKASELSLIASQALMLHEGSRAYLKHSTPHRRLREAYFIAIVTPAIKHLMMEIQKRENRVSDTST